MPDLPYEPNPLDTSSATLSDGLLALTDYLAENAHEIWAAQRLKDGWRFGEKRDDSLKLHPCLIPYNQLPDSEKQYDRNAAMETLKAILLLGFKIERDA